MSNQSKMAKLVFPLLWGRPRCPDCDEVLAAESMNLQEGVALCPGCGRLSRLSELNFSGRSVRELLAKPPAGCSVQSDGQQAHVTASLRTWSGFFASGLAALFWNGLLSVFVLIAVAGLYSNLIGPLPEWLPGLDTVGGKPKMNGKPMGLGEAIFVCVFLTPFILIGLGMMGVACLNLFGRIDVVLDEFGSYVTTGVGKLRWKTRFDAREIVAVESLSYSDGEARKRIELTTDRPIRFGSMLQKDRMIWLRAVLRQLLMPPSEGHSATNCRPLSWISRRGK